jgi:hypothetical protein
MNDQALRLTARILVSIWALWWVFFAVASSAGPHMSMSPTLLIPASIVLALILTVAVAWLWPTAGGILLIAESLFVIGLWLSGFFHPRFSSGIVSVIAVLAIPPLIAGILLLLSRDRAQMHPA